MKRQLPYILIGILIGTLPGLTILIWRGGSMRSTTVDWFKVMIGPLGISVLMGGIPGAVGGWIGGAVAKHNLGAVAGGILGSIYWAFAAATMM